jgi:6-phosphogluconolactonase (cycloisomerase 2 family)
MSFSTVAARTARFLVFAMVAATGANLAACGSSGGISSDLPSGPPTQAPPGNLVIYAAMASGNRIDAFRLGSDGLLPSQPFSSIFVTNPRRLVIAGDVLYATLNDRIIAIQLGADGTLPNDPSSRSLVREDYDPVDLEVRDNILYVAAAGLGHVESFELAANGNIPIEPAATGTGQFPADFASLALNGEYLYSGSRQTNYIDVFLLEADGNVPLEAELQDPQDAIALPDDIEIRDNVLYVTSASDQSIRAYRILPNGFLPGDYNSRTKGEEYYSDIMFDGDTLYAAAYNAGRIDLYAVSPNGMLPEEKPFRRTQDDPSSYPAHMLMNGGILYVAQAGLNRIDAYVLDGNGLPPTYPSSSTTPAPGDSYPLNLALYELN